jgi:hypothetical protein
LQAASHTGVTAVLLEKFAVDRRIASYLEFDKSGWTQLTKSDMFEVVVKAIAAVGFGSRRQ